MRIWDLNPGYLNRNSLLGEHRELHGILNILTLDKKGYSRHPETLRWKDRLEALKARHELLVSEMRLRGFKHHSPVTVEGEPVWPKTFIDVPAEQYQILAQKYADKEPGRIPLPRNAQELWAQHKYSVMARDPERYRGIGRSLATPGDSPSIADLATEMVATLRRRPLAGRLKNALLHLWGYVKDLEGAAPEPPAELIATVRELATRHAVTYLLHSTALSDLDAWIAIPERQQ
jgi:hypothetical protein